MITERQDATALPGGDATEPPLSWCLGVPASGSRALRAEEVAEVRALRRRILLSLWQVPALLLGVLALVLAWGLVAGRVPSLAEGFPATVLAAVGLLGPAFAVLRLRDLLRRARALGRDLRRGELEVFQSPAGGESAEGEKGLSARHVEVLPHSRLLFRLDGVAPEKPRQVEIARAAAPPRHAVRWAFPRSWVSESEDLEGLSRRRLSEGERAELGRSIRTLRKPSGCLLGLAAFFLLMVAAMAVNHWRGGPIDTGFSDVLAGVLWTFALGRGIFHYVRARRLAERLDFDLDAGWVAVMARDDREAAEPAPPGDLEVLPTAGLPWTESGRPAPWRFEMGAG
ncbi:MAG TPA: hypothetical protein VF017_14620 [Thermoanaerobaculia bacterium]|nr:hypothetical protein [Thermoanaerobaculia bacterium]